MSFYDLSNEFLVPLLYFVAAAGVVWSLGNWLLEMFKSYREVYIEETGRHLDDMFLALSPAQVMGLAQIVGVGFFLGAFAMVGSFESTPRLIATGLFSLIWGAIGFMIPRGVVKRMRQKRLERFNEQLVEAMQTMSNALRAGFSILQAFDMVVKENRRPISEEFGLFLHQHRLGMRFEEALEKLSQRVGSQDLDLMINAIEIARQTGGNLTEVFDQLAGVIRERMRVEGKIRTLTAQGRLQAIIVGLMPLLLAGAMYMISPQMMTRFVFSTAGIVIISIGLIFEVVGYLVIRKIVSIDI
ncbi:MAG: type II secretion system F family protein [Verrucomicrobiae bacterium]|nr:type II secretion system F family protein [Verrucomicrobiae bacterium]